MLIPFTYKFVHDRIQQAIYNEIMETDKNIFHLQIGRLLIDDNIPDKNNIYIKNQTDKIGTGSVKFLLYNFDI